MTDLIHTPKDMRSLAEGWKRKGERTLLVPTMGALHAGHLSLVEQAKAQGDRVVVSIFVNPLQFGPNEDLERYPRHEARDTARLSAMHVDVLYLPKAEAMYPEGFTTKITPGRIGEMWCGAARPGHFDGVATVVAKLLLQCGCDAAVFGEKDYQQLQIIRQMVRDLDLPVEVLSGATIREADGLAMSSRNEYLSAEERRIAPKLQAMLVHAAAELRKQPSKVAEVLGQAEAGLRADGFKQVDYFALCDAATLEPLEALDRPARLLAAVWLGKTRLIDNLAVEC